MRLLALDCYEATETQIMTISGQTGELLGANDSWNYSKSGSDHDPVIFTAQKLLMVIISINIDLNLFNVYVLYFHYGKASNIRLGLHGPAYCRN